jgi:putative DNA primase/helicase
MYEDLAEVLGVEVNAIRTLGVGFDYKYQAWVFPERNFFGDIIGLSYRYADGSKTMAPTATLPGKVKKSKRGLTYPINQQFDSGVKRYNPGRHNWSRVADVGVTCPVCKKPDWCLVSAEDPLNPQAVLCKRIDEGSVKETEGGFLHVRKNSGRLTTAAKLVLPPSDLPLVIVEGSSDVLAAMSMGFVAVGRPNCGACAGLLSKMPLAGREVWIIGENDAGAGIKGMEETFAVVSKLTSNVKMLLPPEGIKDLRAWLQAGLTCEDLIEYVAEHGQDVAASSVDVFPDAQPTTVADAMVEHMSVDGKPTIVLYKDKRYKWNGSMYKELLDTELTNEVLDFMVGKRITTETLTGTVVRPLPTTSKWVRDVLFCLPRSCPIAREQGWLSDHDKPPLDQLLSFKNGILDVGEYLESGSTKLFPSSPDLFVLGSFPYPFDPDAECPDYEKFVLDTQLGNKDMAKMLQHWAGYVLVPDMTLEKLVLMVGKPRAGKGTIIECMKALIGGDLCSSLQLSHFTSQFGRQAMMGKLLGVFGDAKAPRAAEADMCLAHMLAITGADAVNVNRKYHDELTNVYLKIRFMIAMNELPRFSDNSYALAARALPFNFEKSWAGKEDFDLKPRLVQAAKDGLLINWALRGLRELREGGRFHIPKHAEALLNDLRGASSPVRLFVQEVCDRTPISKVEKNLLYKVWVAWCDQQRMHPGSKDSFSRKLINAVSGVEPKRVSIEGRRIWYYTGVGLNDKAVSELID